MFEFAVRNLAAAVNLQAVKDYFNKKATPKKRVRILRDLRSTWMRDLTNGTSANVADELEKHPEEIRERLRRHAVEDEL